MIKLEHIRHNPTAMGFDYILGELEKEKQLRTKAESELIEKDKALIIESSSRKILEENIRQQNNALQGLGQLWKQTAKKLNEIQSQ